MSLSEVVPAVVTTFLPARSAKSLTPPSLDGAVLNERNPVGGGNRDEFDVDLVELELGLNGVDRLQHQRVRIADYFLIIVIIGEWHGRFTVSQSDGGGVLDFL